MALQDIIGALAPNTADQIRRIANPDQSQGGSILGIPVALASDVVTPPLQLANAGAGIINQIPERYPQLAKLIGGLGALGVGINGDPTAAARIQRFQAEQQMLQNQQLAMQQINNLYPNFDPTDMDQVMGAARITDFVSAFPSAIAGPDSREIASFATSAQRSLEDSQQVETAYSLIVNSKREYVGPVALITSFARLLDPGSVVRGEEVDVIMNSGGIPDALRSKMLSMFEGGEIDPTVHRYIVEQSAQYINAYRRRFRPLYRDWVAMAENAGIADELEIGSLRIPPPVATGDADLDSLYEEREGAPEVPADAPMGAEVIWRRDIGSWVLVWPDSRRPTGFDELVIGD